jgi:hypothetical protein
MRLAVKVTLGQARSDRQSEFHGVDDWTAADQAESHGHDTAEDVPAIDEDSYAPAWAAMSLSTPEPSARNKPCARPREVPCAACQHTLGVIITNGVIAVARWCGTRRGAISVVPSRAAGLIPGLT